MSKHHHTRVSEIWVDEENIMHVVFGKGVTIDLRDMEEAYAIFRALGVGPGQRKSRQLLSGGHFTLTNEARAFAGKSGQDYFIAAAMVTDSALMRLVINTFNLLTRHGVPFKLFATEEEALAWLRKFTQ
jgi:hypothetical protein